MEDAWLVVDNMVSRTDPELRFCYHVVVIREA